MVGMESTKRNPFLDIEYDYAKIVEKGRNCVPKRMGELRAKQYVAFWKGEDV